LFLVSDIVNRLCTSGQDFSKQEVEMENIEPKLIGGLEVIVMEEIK
jgi:hypothetical protein